jgi:hypothetical protein
LTVLGSFFGLILGFNLSFEDSKDSSPLAA